MSFIFDLAFEISDLINSEENMQQEGLNVELSLSAKIIS